MDTREYASTHPWLRFPFDAGGFDHAIWMLLGAVQAKCEHVESSPLDRRHADELLRICLMKGVHATTAIEGNTLSEDAVGRILDGKEQMPKSLEYQEREITNIARAYNDVFNKVVHGACQPITVEEICNINREVLSGLELEDGVVPGKIRDFSVTVGRYRGAPAQDCEHLLEETCRCLNDRFGLGAGWEYAEWFLKGILAHLYIAWIHPFGDGNGRTARLIELRMCANAGIAKPACHLLSNFYNRTRQEYYRKLAESSQKKDPACFVRYALQGASDSLDEQLKTISGYQMLSAWKNIVHARIQGTSDAAQRRRRLAIALFDTGREVPRSELRTLTTGLAADYSRSQSGSKVVARDVSFLGEKGLVVENGGLVSANRAEVLSLLPERKRTTRPPCWYAG